MYFFLNRKIVFEDVLNCKFEAVRNTVSLKFLIRVKIHLLEPHLLPKKNTGIAQAIAKCTRKSTCSPVSSCVSSSKGERANNTQLSLGQMKTPKLKRNQHGMYYLRHTRQMRDRNIAEEAWKFCISSIFPIQRRAFTRSWQILNRATHIDKDWDFQRWWINPS